MGKNQKKKAAANAQLSQAVFGQSGDRSMVPELELEAPPECLHCAVHRATPPELLSIAEPCGSLPVGIHPSIKFKGTGRGCHATPDTKARDLQCLEAIRSGDRMTLRQWASSTPASMGDFGRFYCWLSAFHPKIFWRVSRILGEGALLSGDEEGRDLLTVLPALGEPRLSRPIRVEVVTPSNGKRPGDRGVLHFRRLKKSSEEGALTTLDELLLRLRAIQDEDPEKYWLVGATPTPTNTDRRGVIPCPKFPDLDADQPKNHPGGKGRYCYTQFFHLDEQAWVAGELKSGPLLLDLLPKLELRGRANAWHGVTYANGWVHVTTGDRKRDVDGYVFHSNTACSSLVAFLAKECKCDMSKVRVGWSAALGPGTEWDLGYGVDEGSLRAPTDPSWADFNITTPSSFDELTLDMVTGRLSQGLSLDLAGGITNCSDCGQNFNENGDCACVFSDDKEEEPLSRASDGDEEDPAFWNVKLDNPCRQGFSKSGNVVDIVTINGSDRVVTGPLKEQWKTPSAIKNNTARLRRADGFRTSAAFFDSVVDSSDGVGLLPCSVLCLGLSPSAALRTMGGTKINHVPSGRGDDPFDHLTRVARQRHKKKKRKPPIARSEKKISDPDLDGFLDDCIRQNWILSTIERRKSAGLKVPKQLRITLRDNLRGKWPPDKNIKRTPKGVRVKICLPKPTWEQVQNSLRLAKGSAWSTELSPIIGRSWFSRSSALRRHQYKTKND